MNSETAEIIISTPACARGIPRKAWIVTAATVALILLLLWVIPSLYHKGSEEVRTVPVIKVERQDLSDYMTLQAGFIPYQDILVHAKVSGYVSAIHVDIGDRVKEGELLASLEVPELQDNLNKANASLQSAQQQVSRAQADYNDAHLIYQRLKDVANSHPKLIAQQDIDTASSRDSGAEAALGVAKHDVQEQQAEVGRVTTLLSYTQITAPFDGIVTKRFADTGALLAAGTSESTQAMPLVELAQYNILRLCFPVPEAETPLIQPGKPIEVTVAALDKTFTGTITRSAWKIDDSTRTMLTEVDVPNPDGTLQAGMYASIKLPLYEEKQALAVPLQALSPGEDTTVLVLGKDNKIEERNVKVGVRTANMAQILSGLQEGDLVIIGSRAGLSPGTTASGKMVDLSSITLQS